MKSPEAASLRSEIGDILSIATQSNEAALIKRADFLIEEEVQAIAAEERRRAVLEGLAGLGYEVSEGMATAWVNGGRVVLRKAASPGYGVELSGGSKSDLLQVGAVAYGNSTEPRDASRDRDIETIWCGEFERLQNVVTKDGGHLSLESAHPIGLFPLKVVEDKHGMIHDNDVVRTPRHLEPIVGVGEETSVWCLEQETRTLLLFASTRRQCARQFKLFCQRLGEGTGMQDSKRKCAAGESGRRRPP